jgi:hypothetical protein
VVLYVDGDMRQIDDPSILRLLGAPYRSAGEHGSDYNLGSRHEALYGHIDALQFAELCNRARSKSEQILREDPDFIAAVASAADRGRRQTGVRLRRLRQRLAVTIDEGGSLSREIALQEYLLMALDEPKVTLDAIGAIVLCGEAPQEAGRG